MSNNYWNIVLFEFAGGMQSVGAGVLWVFTWQWK